MPYDAMRDEYYPVHRPKMLDLSCHNPHLFGFGVPGLDAPNPTASEEPTMPAASALILTVDVEEMKLIIDRFEAVEERLEAIEERLWRLEQWHERNAPLGAAPILCAAPTQ